MSDPKGQQSGVASSFRFLVAAILFLVVSLVGRSVYAGALAIAPTGAVVAPLGTQTFTATGGSGSGYVWSLSANLSGGSITAAGGVYTAGATPNVVDEVQVTDSASNTATTAVIVGAGVSVSPATATVVSGGTQTFTASGGSPPYAWSLTTDGSGSTAAITATGGVYTAGTTPGTDVVTATDSVGSTGTATITVTVAKVAAGAACTTTAACPTGSTCVDGVCCNSACDGQCQACNTAGSVGICVTITGPPVGTRPACPQSDTNNVCSSKMCDGTSPTSCTSLVGKETSCGVASCIDEVGTPGAVCQGDGGCEKVAPKSCAPYACVSDSCATSCTNSSECSPGSYCNVTTGKCIKAPPLPVDAGTDASAPSLSTTSNGCSIARAPCGASLAPVLMALLGAIGFRRRRRD